MDGASSSSWSTAGRWTYDVFLSFRGEDTRNNFVDHLYAALDRAGIYTFKDDEKLQRGKSIAPELMKAIEESMVSVVVFSKDYANSSWCLQELVKIIECQDVMGQKVLPVFYDVEPSDVRGQKGSFQTAFQQHEVKFIDDFEKVKRWREVLTTTANLSGWDVTASGHEAECINQIVKTILSYTGFSPEENLIGMDSRVRRVKALLREGADDVYFIGIWGMGGIGKTTIARAVYRQISYEFAGSSFLEDVRENGSDKRGLKSLQEKLLSEILMQEQFKVKDCDDGMCQIRRRFGRKKVLVVLDDVDSFKQLQFLVGSREWFGPGSRIMITTRDEHLLCYAQEKYAPELLNGTEAMKLFSRYAFMKHIPPKEFEELSSNVVRHAGHLPLALKVLGSHFCGRNLEFWLSELKVLAKIPHNEINGILKLSYDGLNILEKKIFLHIACFFKGKERRDVTSILFASGFEAVSGITVLIEKSLLTTTMTTYNEYLHMHDLIQEMGQCIVRECYPNTMVSFSEEVKEVMTTISGLEAVEAMVDVCPLNTTRSIVRCSAELLKSMKKLMLLHVRGQFTSDEPSSFSEELRCLSWRHYPFDCLRITKHMTKLVGLLMYRSSMRQLQFENKVILPNLKFINLCDSLRIRMFPSVLGVPNLEWLNLSHCNRLEEVHESVFLHGKIIYLNLSYCESLEILPSVIKMKSLHTMLLCYCHRLKTLPEVSIDMERLSILHIHGCYSLRVLPSSIRLLTGLTTLTMGGSFCEVANRELSNPYIQGALNLSSLRVLYLGQNLLDDSFTSNLHTAWPSLEEFDLYGNMLTRLPASISHLSHLKRLNLRDCICLKELHELPPLIQVLKAQGCTSLQKIGDLSNTYKWLFKISLGRCHKLLEDGESQNHIANLLMKSLVQKRAAVNHRLSISVPGSKIPNWLSNQRLGNKIELYLPHSQVSKVIGIAICCRLSLNKGFLTINVNPSYEGNSIGCPTHPAKSVDGMWVGYMPIGFLGNLFHGIEYENLIVSFEDDDNVVECGVCVLYKDDIKPMTGIGSWILDYDEFRKIDYHNAINEEDLQHGRWAHHGIAPPVTIRNAIPVFAAPPLPIPHMGIAPQQFRGMPPPMCGVASPVTIRQALPIYSAPSIPKHPMKLVPTSMPPIEEPVHPKTPVISAILSKPSEEEAKCQEPKLEKKMKELQI